MRAPVLSSPVLRSPGLRSPGLMRSAILRSPGLRSSGLMRSPILRAPVLRSPMLYLYLEEFPDLSGVKELVSRPIIDMKFSRLRRFPGLRKFSGLKKSLVLYSYMEELGVQTSVSATCTQRLLTTDDLGKCVKKRLSQERSKKFDPRIRILIPAQYLKAVGVQVLGTLLNKNMLTGDDYWGVRWQQIPESLRCYALGDIMFGFVSYNVLSGLLLRDVLPDPDVLCRFLKCYQKTAAGWFLDFILMSPEGVEFNQAVKEGAETRMRSKRMVWLNKLSSDREYEERTRWKDETPALSTPKKRSGVKR